MASPNNHRQPCDAPSEKSTRSFWHSQPSPLLTAHRSTRELPKKADVVIVGSGITGAGIAHHLLSGTNGGARGNWGAEGPSVVMLEAREACWGATGRNGGHCQPILFYHPHAPEIGRFEIANFRALQTLIATKNIDCEFVAQPGVQAIYSQQQLTDIELALYTIANTAPDLARKMKLITDPAGLRELRVPTAMAAVVTDEAARLWPYRFVGRILEDLLKGENEMHGSFNLQTLTPVTALSAPNTSVQDSDGRWTVCTERGNIAASRVALATNAWTSHLLPSFADLIVPVRGQMSALVPPPSVYGERRLKTSLGFMAYGTDDYLHQRSNDRGGQLMFGGGRQCAPSIGVSDDSVIDEATATYLRRQLLDVLDLSEGSTNMKNDGKVTAPDGCQASELTEKPKTGADTVAITELVATYQWTGVMAFSRDELPWIGPVPEHPGLYIAAGYSGHGMPNAWLCAKTVALMMANASPRSETELSSSHRGTSMMDGFTESDHAAAVETGLPQGYMATKERMKRVLEDYDDVEITNTQDIERGKRERMEEDARPCSGYA